MAHNSDTLEDDLEQLRKLLAARQEYEALAWVERETKAMAEVSDHLWTLWESMVPDEVAKGSETATGWEADRIEDRKARRHAEAHARDTFEHETGYGAEAIS